MDLGCRAGPKAAKASRSGRRAVALSPELRFAKAEQIAERQVQSLHADVASGFEAGATLIRMTDHVQSQSLARQAQVVRDLAFHQEYHLAVVQHSLLLSLGGWITGTVPFSSLASRAAVQASTGAVTSKRMCSGIMKLQARRAHRV